jgi:hypothetical protein
MTSTTTERRFGVNAGRAIKVPCKIATTENLTLAGEQTIDGIVCVDKDRALVKSQSNNIENGVYLVSTGAWIRDADWDDQHDVTQGTLIAVNQGTVNADRLFQVDTAGIIIPGQTGVDISTIEYSGDLADMQDDIADNAAAIAANTGNIATNAGDIASNTSDISTNAGDITTNANDIATNVSNISTNASDITTVESNADDLQIQISELQTGIGITPSPALFTISVPDDSLTYFIAPFPYAGDAYQIVSDDDTEPLWDAGTWITGAVPSQSGSIAVPDMAGYAASETKYLWTRNGAVVSQGLPAANDPLSDGNPVPGLVIKAKDTLSPESGTTAWVLTTGTDPTTDVSVTLPVFTDAGSGIDRVDLWNWDISGNYTLYKSDIGNTGVAINLSGNTPGQSFDLAPIAYDNFGNTVELPHKALTLDSAADGEVNFSGYTVEGGNLVYDVDEDDLSVTITLEWTGGASNPAFTVDVSTVEYIDNAADTVEFTALSSDTKTFGAGEVDNKITFTVTLIDTDALQNNMFGIVIDTGSIDGATPTVEIGAINGVNVRILGSGAPSASGYEQDASSDELLVMECKNMTSTPENGDGFNAIAQSRALTDTSIKSSLASDQGNATTIGDGSATVSGSSCPYRTIDVVWRSSVVQYFWLRFWRNSNTVANVCHIALDDDATGDAALLNANVDATDGIVSQFFWINKDEADNVLATTGAVTAGAGSIQLCPYKTGTQVDRILVTSNASYDPNISGAFDAEGLDRGNSGDDFYGAPESRQVVSGSVVDNVNNPDFPPVPAIGGTPVTMTLNPVDGFTAASVSVNPSLSYESGSEITSAVFTVTANAVSVNGTVSINAVGTTVTFIPDVPFDNSVTSQSIDITATGTVKDENGDVRDYNPPSWIFTIPKSSNYVWEETFNDLSVGTKWDDVWQARIEAQGLTRQADTIGSKTIIMDDPLGNPSRGRVLASYQEAGTTGTTGEGLCDMQIILPSTYTELYFSYDWMWMKNDPNTGFPTEKMILTKMPGLAASAPGTNLLGLAAGGNQPTGVPPSAWSARCQRMRYGDGGIVDGKWAHAGYLYGADPDQDPSTDTGHGNTDEYYNQVVQWGFVVDDSFGEYFEMTGDEWHEIKIKVVLNTENLNPAPNNLPIRDGQFYLWIDGVLRRSNDKVPWRVSGLPINMVFFSTGYGGDPSNSIYYPDNPQYTYYDNLRVTTDATVPPTPTAPTVTSIEVLASQPDEVIVTLDEDATKDDDWINGFEVVADTVVIPIVSVTESSGVVTITVNRNLLVTEALSVRYTR